MAAHHAAFKEILQNEEIKKLREENERLKRDQEPKNRQVQLSFLDVFNFATDVACMQTEDFPVTDAVCISESETEDDDSSIDDNFISPYEAAAIKRREENKKLIRKLGLGKVILLQLIDFY